MESNEMTFHAPIPILRIFDEAKARQFYIEWLGFKVDWEHRFEPGTPIYMQVSRGGCVLHLSEHHGDGTPGTYVRVQVDQLEDYLAELQSRPYKYFRPSLTDQEWHQREMCVYDGFGNRIIFSKPIP
jgi:catechol 2,3-dioxygenase-like lactoylglutathione lyase family enzyme